ncbi:hypothetical protein DRE_04648 [Drechslerella stenobrocha 248]|uniref:SAM-dependent MTase RsmB/NOP-type domain-containing protein n=1 Tax=Drechslerella stenobrocha 248 TaxID=1043628 RepID=W7HS96_9PEZI|nr:hypothetical protein DRE_04648 [Drechslerella stenobrocha 248]
MAKSKRGKRAGERKHRSRDTNDDRTGYAEIERENANFRAYYVAQGIIPDENDFQRFWASLKEVLPTTWRFTGSKGHAVTVRNTLLNRHIPVLTNTTFEGAAIPAPTPLPWYPDQLAWQLTVGKQVIRRSPPFKQLQAFLVSETSSGNISRQEAVSMIPPLLMDVESHHTVLDMCAAPGSKTAQLIEAIHAGEEERVAEASKRLNTGDEAAEVAGRTAAEAALGRSTGIVIANDADYKRSHLLIHQTKRLNTPNFIVTNYDATLYPSLRLPSTPARQEYLKFDRVLCDVPCSGDGTVRKNPMIWKDWSAANGNGLWSTQTRILVRGLQLLKVGGRLVYSTCSLNPVENEAVVHAAIERCGGPDAVEVVDVSDRLPGLVRREGMTTWKVMDRDGTWFERWEDVREKGEPYTDRLTKGMFPPEEKEGELAGMLKRAVRVYPHLQDTGGFFIMVLRKKGQIKAAPEGEVARTGARGLKAVKAENGDVAMADAAEGEEEAGKSTNGKRALSADVEEADVDPGSPTKRQKLEPESDGGEAPTAAPEPTPDGAKEEQDDSKEGQEERKELIHKKPRGNFNEEPFKYLPATHAVLDAIKKFYALSAHFPMANFLVRNAEGIPVRTIYYTSSLARAILTENEGRGVRFVHCGVKMFNRQEVQDPEACPWRIQNEGLSIVEGWVGERRVVRLKKRETLRWLMKELFPRVEDCGEIKEQVERVGAGCCVLRVDVEDEEEEAKGVEVGRLVVPLWKSRWTLNLMLPKEERRAMLLRLFDDTEGPLDSTKEQREADARARKAAEAEAQAGQDGGDGAAPAEEEEEE